MVVDGLADLINKADDALRVAMIRFTNTAEVVFDFNDARSVGCPTPLSAPPPCTLFELASQLSTPCPVAHLPPHMLPPPPASHPYALFAPACSSSANVKNALEGGVSYSSTSAFPFTNASSGFATAQSQLLSLRSGEEEENRGFREYTVPLVVITVSDGVTIEGGERLSKTLRPFNRPEVYVPCFLPI